MAGPPLPAACPTAEETSGRVAGLGWEHASVGPGLGARANTPPDVLPTASRARLLPRERQRMQSPLQSPGEEGRPPGQGCGVHGVVSGRLPQAEAAGKCRPRSRLHRK